MTEALCVSLIHNPWKGIEMTKKLYGVIALAMIVAPVTAAPVLAQSRKVNLRWQASALPAHGICRLAETAPVTPSTHIARRHRRRARMILTQGEMRRILQPRPQAVRDSLFRRRDNQEGCTAARGI